jgi:hypothetical protein
MNVGRDESAYKLAPVPEGRVQFLTNCQCCPFASRGRVFHHDNLILIYEFICSFMAEMFNGSSSHTAVAASSSQ